MEAMTGQPIPGGPSTRMVVQPLQNATRLASWLHEPGERVGFPPRQDYLKPYSWPRVAERLDELAERYAARGHDLTKLG